MRCLCLSASMAFFVAISTSAADPPKAKPAEFEVVGLQVQRALSGAKEELTSFGKVGTGIDLYVSLPGKHIICTDADLSKVSSFVDDKGTDLTLPQPGLRAGGGWINEFKVGQISKDGERTRIDIRSVGIPQKGSKTVTVKGSVVLKCGSEVRTVQTANIDWPADGKKVQVGDYTLAGGYEGFGTDAMATIGSDIANIKDVTVYGPDNKELKSSLMGIMKFPGTFEGGKYRQSVHVTKPTGKVTVRITYFSKVEDVAVPVDLTVGLGL